MHPKENAAQIVRSAVMKCFMKILIPLRQVRVNISRGQRTLQELRFIFSF